MEFYETLDNTRMVRLGYVVLDCDGGKQFNKEKNGVKNSSGKYKFIKYCGEPQSCLGM